jgi:hypothetical protein
MNNKQQLIEAFVKPSRGRGVERNDESYTQCQDTTSSELGRLVDMYRNTVFVEDMRARLLRDSVDHWVRRYHKYAIQGKIKSHYREVGVDEKDCVFEHVLPASSVVDMLLQGRLDIVEALNTPTCLIKSASNNILSDNGLTKQSPDNWRFFRRYQILNSEFVAYNGQSIPNIYDWTLEDHWKFFGVKQ